MSKPPVTGKPVWREEHQRIAAALRRARKKAGLSQSAVAAKLGRPTSYVSKLERGVQEIGVIELIDYCGAVGVRAGDLLNGIEEG